jgi:hypothetical protein
VTAPRRSRRKIGAWLLAIGLLVAVPCVVRAVQVVADSIDGPQLSVPGTTTVHIGSGRWIVFELVGSRSDYGPIHTSTSGFVTIAPGDVRVRGGATPTAVRDVTGSQTITTGSDIYAGAVEFSVPQSGDYEITISAEQSGRAKLARPITDTIGKAALWGIAAGLGTIAAILGLVLVLVGNPTPKPVFTPVMAPMPQQHAAPPGWYADPGGFGGPRWWDGHQWTEHASAPPPPPPR